MKNQRQIKIEEIDLMNLLIYSFRYAIGRQTYAVAQVAELIKEYKYFIPRFAMEQMTADIRLAIDTASAGMECDVAVWEDLYLFLSSEILHCQK